MTEASDTVAPSAALRAARSRPLRRFLLLAVFAATLPFTWGESSSCNGPPRQETGLDLFFERPENAVKLAVIFVAPSLLGLLTRWLRPAALRLAAEIPAMMFAAIGTIYCFVSSVLGNQSNRLGGPYLAPWVATLASLLTTFDASQGVVERARELLTERAKRGTPPGLGSTRAEPCSRAAQRCGRGAAPAGGPAVG